MSGFAVIATVTAFLILFILSFGRIVRWYMHRRPRATQVLGDPLAQVIDSKPRVSKLRGFCKVLIDGGASEHDSSFVGCLFN